MSKYFKTFELEGYTYRSNKIITAVAFVLILIIGFVALNYSKFSGVTYYYSSCPVENQMKAMGNKCFNEFYNSNLCRDGTISSDNVLCTTKYIEAGQSLGTKAPYLVRNFTYISGGIVLLTLLLNTLIYNKGFFAYLKGKWTDV